MPPPDPQPQGVDTPTVDRYAVLGHPVAHSRSPFIHQAFARQTGQSLRYERLEVPPGGFVDAVRAYAQSGARGCNVTVPFKFEVLPLAARHTPRAALAQAANTLRFDREGWWADNTDGVGLVADIRLHAGRAIEGSRVLLIGAGGAAAGVLGPLLAERPEQLAVVNRTLGRARELVERHADWARLHGVGLQAAALEAAPDLVPQGYDLVINGTASSLSGDAAPVSAKVLRPGCLAVDMMYGAAAQGFLAWAREAGAEGRDGLGMLVEQAAEAFAAWRGVRPHTTAVLRALREAVDAGH